MKPKGKDSHKKMLLFSQSEETTNSKPISIEPMDGETVRSGSGVGEGGGGEGRRIWGVSYVQKQIHIIQKTEQTQNR